MAELTKLLLVVLAIHIVLTLVGIFNIPGSVIYEIVTTPEGWANTSWVMFLTDILTVSAGLIVAGGVVFKNDFAVYGGLCGIFLSFGAGFAELFRVVTTHGNITIAIFFVSPIILIYIGTLLAFWRGRA